MLTLYRGAGFKKMAYQFENKHYCTHIKRWDSLGPLLGNYFLDGIQKNENIHYYSDRWTSENLLEALQLPEKSSVQIRRALESGQLQIFSAQQVYLKNGFFHLFDRLNDIAEVLDDSARLGFQGFRAVGEMDWIRKAQNPDIFDLVTEYENRCNEFFKSGRVTALCIYCEESLPPDLCFRNFHSHPELQVVNNSRVEVLVNPLMNGREAELNYLEDLRRWIQYLRSLGLNWMSRVDTSAKDQFKREVYRDLSNYIDGDGFSQKGIPDLYLNISALLD